MNDLQVRWMIRRDMPEVVDIEASAFEFPWSEDEFIRALRQRNCIGMVAERDTTIVGYMIYELHKTSIWLSNIAVHADYRRKGVGVRLIAKLAAKLNPQRRRNIWVGIRESNLSGQLFFRDCGFRATGILKGFHSVEETDEDAYRMVLTARGFETCRRMAQSASS